MKCECCVPEFDDSVEMPRATSEEKCECGGDRKLYNVSGVALGPAQDMPLGGARIRYRTVCMKCGRQTCHRAVWVNDLTIQEANEIAHEYLHDSDG
jgi:hypothetical protein